jgi:hypothetical protein
MRMVRLGIGPGPRARHTSACNWELDNLRNSDRLFIVMIPIFKKQASKVIDNLYVAYDGDVPVGMVHRPKNTRTDKNFWRCYVGVGENARFLGHAVNRRDAENHVSWAYCTMNATVATVA